MLVTLYTDFFLSGLWYTAPTPKNDLILLNISLSFSCKFISNEVLTFHLKGADTSIIIEKQPSASTKPVTQLGSSLYESCLIEKFFLILYLHLWN